MSEVNVDVVRRLYEVLGGPELDKVTEEIWIRRSSGTPRNCLAC
jgi:hypothetical protein